MATVSTKHDRKEEHPRPDIWVSAERQGNLPMVIPTDRTPLYHELLLLPCTAISSNLLSLGISTIITITTPLPYLLCTTSANRLLVALPLR